ncbi:hypothetical protein SLEP1_g52468 [Rubroshorea leprosula]|uniref:Uncharacterized protein n=1 Tax=Rubroshorea leprosula TaxID=152421 RepID=A0AAV5M7F7_9ROSI|nr:hypothetical protein SLEP1_g52468 [Rubroshorea leprosula]
MSRMKVAFRVGILLAALILSVAVVLGEFQTTFELKRAIPLSHQLDLSQLRARDAVRHGRLLQSSGGVVDSPGFIVNSRAGFLANPGSWVAVRNPACEFARNPGSWVACDEPSSRVREKPSSKRGARNPVLTKSEHKKEKNQ